MKKIGAILLIVLFLGLGVLGTTAYFKWDTVKGWFEKDNTETTEKSEVSDIDKNVEITIPSRNN